MSFDLHLVSHGAGDVEQAALLRLLLAPITTASAPAPGGDPWERLSAAGRFERAWVSGVGHTELMWNTELHRRIASMMSAHVDREHMERPSPRWEPSASRSAGVPTTVLPTDPLAYSKALRKRKA